MRSKLFFDELAAERYDAMIDQQGPDCFSHLSRHAKAACSLSSLTCLQGTPRREQRACLAKDPSTTAMDGWQDE
jgi:hypothetical protein